MANLYTTMIWRKLKRNYLAFAGFIILVLAIFTGIFAYALAPDNSPNADLQTVEIQSMRPGYKQMFIKFKTPKSPAKWHNGIFTGKEPGYRYIPITSYKDMGDSVFVDRYIDEDTTVAASFHISELGGPVKDHIETKTYLLGTDAFGRDVLSRLIIGIRISLAVGLIAVIISLILGVLLGALAGYFGGKTDAIILWLINVTWSIPTLLLVFAFTMAAGKGFWQIFIAVGLTMWVSVARLVRGQVVAMRDLEYVQAAKVLGFTNSRIIFRHILPNITGPLMVIAAANFATAIIIEAGLSFLGIGVQPPQPSWGLMIKENYHFIITDNSFLAIVPGLAIMILVLALNLLGNGLRDATDVRMES